MKVAPVVIAQGTKETGENVLILNLPESKIVVAALRFYADANKRNRAARKLADEAETEIPVCP